MNDAPTLAVEVSKPLAEARQFKVSNPEQYSLAGLKLKAIKLLRSKVDQTFDPIIQKAHAAHKEAVGQKKSHELPLIEAEGILKRAMLTFQDEQSRKAREEQARLEERARKEREKLEARAAAAEAAGKVEKAAELQTRAETVATPIVTIETPKVAGIATRETYKAVVFDKMALIRAVAAGEVPDAVLNYDQAVLNAQARALKGALSYPGIRVETVQSISSRAE